MVRDLTNRFADERKRLEQELKEGDQLSTEDLRTALRHYRSFFHKLLGA